MNELGFPYSSDETAARDDGPNDEEPQFGALDVVEAFTAMRHEWRSQTKATRELAEEIQAAAERIQELEAKLLASASDPRGNEPQESKKLARLIAETDHQLSRGLAAAQAAESRRRLREEADAQAAERYFENMSGLARWFARPFWNFITQQRQARNQTEENPAIEGLNLLLARLARSMKEQQIERIDAEGQPFDANTMNAIGTVESEEYPSGHVAEQLSPCYRWQGQLLRYAEVRVAK